MLKIEAWDGNRRWAVNNVDEGAKATGGVLTTVLRVALACATIELSGMCSFECGKKKKPWAAVVGKWSVTLMKG
jgi:hypothetical protein